MGELGSILETWRIQPDAPGVLATVVHVEGSAYRRPGARMLMLANGTRIGTISGGCLESDVVKKAPWWTANNTTVLRTYDTRSDDEAVWEFGLGCNGVIHVLLEPLESSSSKEALAFLHTMRAGRRCCVIATVVRTTGDAPSVGERLLYDPSGPSAGSLRGTSWHSALESHIHDTLLERKSRLVHLATCDVFVEWVAPQQPLIVFGAGHDALPLANIAKTLGWHVTIVDGRPAFANPSRFTGADVRLLPSSASIDSIAIPPDAAVVVMTHNYPLDKKLLPQIVERKPRYLGLLGPRSRAEHLLEETGLSGEGLHYPVGLDIGGDMPETIALAIAAEIQAALTGRPASFLKIRADSIHTPAHTTGDPHLSFDNSATAVATCEVHV